MSAIAFAIGVIIVVIGGKQDANLVDVEEKSNTMSVKFDFIKKLKDIRVFF